MATTFHQRLSQYLGLQPETCQPWQCVKGDPKHTVPVPFHEALKNTSHTVLQVQRPVSPGPERFPVTVFNGSDGKRFSVTVRSIDTIAKLQQEVLKLNPDLGENLNLAFNGKPVLQHQTLSELQVKPGAMFVTFQKCHGG